jgi:hypothetical protein
MEPDQFLPSLVLRRFLVWNRAGASRDGRWPPGDLPMPEKTPGGPRKRAGKPSEPKVASPVAAPMAERYIAAQLKLVYDAVAAEPVPDRLLQLLDRLGDDAEK